MEKFFAFLGYELWKRRLRIFTKYHFTGEPSIGNDIILDNLSNHPILIDGWEIFWERGFLFWKKYEVCAAPDPASGYCDIKIGPQTSYKMSFSNENHFDWGVSTISKGKLYIKLNMPSRKKPLQLLVYDPNK